MKAYLERVDRLANKIKMSRSRVPGLIMGLSGTDSILAFVMSYDAMAVNQREDCVVGVHFVGETKRPTWFEERIIPWLNTRCPKAQIDVAVPLGGNQDQQRWADLHLRAVTAFDESYWVVGTINATEKALGRYSVLASAVSVQPLMTMTKTRVLEACRFLGVPAIAEEYSRIPDCFCGRDELAAQNIELIDDILAFRVNPSHHDPALLASLYAYIAESKSDYDFKQRIPYII